MSISKKEGIPTVELPALISKKALCIHFRVATGRTLRRRIFTNEVLEALKIDPAYYDSPSTRNFSLLETRRIYDYFKIMHLRT